MKTLIEKYTEKFIAANFDRKDLKKDPSIKFEWFVNSLHAWEYSSQSYNAKPKIGKEISLGASQGGDAFFILAGNKIYSLNDNIEDVDEAIKQNTNKAEFHLIQTKKSNSAKVADFINFASIPIRVIKGQGIAEHSKELKLLEIFISQLKDRNPELDLSFILTFYTEKDENNITNLRKSWKADIEHIQNEYEEYGKVKVNIEGSKKLNELFEQFNSNDYKLIISKDNCKLDNTNYLIGFITAKELLDCIAPETKSGIRSLYPDVFKNNIRLYLGPTEVNEKIEATLSDEPNKFHLYNNGLTITTKDIKPVLENYIVSPVNIVNGCQTANSIYNTFKDSSNAIELVKIPVKIIIATDDEYEKITIRTNSQNGISEKDLVSITNIQKELEDNFAKLKFQGNSFTYKRQNSNITETPKDVDYVININDILRATFSTIMFIPHKVSGYFDKTTSDLIDVIFDERFLKLYQILTVTFKILEDYLEEKHPENRKLKYHIAYLIYKFTNKDLNINDLEIYFKGKKRNYDELDPEEMASQNDLIQKVYSNMYQFSKDENLFYRVVDYILKVITSKYPELINLTTREKEKILYKTVDETQKGMKVFANFKTNFKKTIEDFKV